MKTKDLVIVAMFTALIAVLGLLPAINLGIGVPFTFQNLGYILAGCLLGSKRGGLSVLLFVLMVAMGLPLLSGGHGGFGLFFGPTGGYILSFPLVAYLIGLLTERKFQSLNVWQVFLINGLIGAILCNLIGGLFMAFNLHLPIIKALKTVIVFVPGDLVKALIAAFLAVRLREIPSIRRFFNTI
ncbi:biotin transporter BioY [Macrococcus hajekii]|uniref:Biotin transporter n=1 Tax=Macrococcus hajekii TaxID=198482 RepID=A0A4R6BK21_9STAP|nr:biotin transporter BioY [Macrococcus hajekii]TDM01911.1 biotin transporter BioY [Macrococcus hajekii]GGB08492.1 biotin transporter BioY [Macrococcus hajekii]